MTICYFRLLAVLGFLAALLCEGIAGPLVGTSVQVSGINEQPLIQQAQRRGGFGGFGGYRPIPTYRPPSYNPPVYRAPAPPPAFRQPAMPIFRPNQPVQRPMLTQPLLFPIKPSTPSIFTRTPVPSFRVGSLVLKSRSRFNFERLSADIGAIGTSIPLRSHFNLTIQSRNVSISKSSAAIYARKSSSPPLPYSFLSRKKSIWTNSSTILKAMPLSRTNELRAQNSIHAVRDLHNTESATRKLQSSRRPANDNYSSFRINQHFERTPPSLPTKYGGNGYFVLATSSKTLLGLHSKAIKVKAHASLVGGIIGLQKRREVININHVKRGLESLNQRLGGKPINDDLRNVRTVSESTVRRSIPKRLDDVIVVTSRGVAISAETLRGQGASHLAGNFRGLNGLSVDQVVSRIPSSWKMISQDYGKGIKFIDEAGYERVRIHGPSTSAPAGSNASKGWVIRVMDRTGQYYDNYGNVVSRHDNDGHILIRVAKNEK